MNSGEKSGLLHGEGVGPDGAPVAGSDADAMNNAYDRLQTASHKLAEVLYSQAGAAGGGEAAGGEQASSASAGAEGDGGSPSSSDDNVIDAEYVDVEDEKK